MTRVKKALAAVVKAVQAAVKSSAVRHDVALFAGFFTASVVLVSGHLTVDAIATAIVVAGRRTVIAIAAQLAARKAA